MKEFVLPPIEFRDATWRWPIANRCHLRDVKNSCSPAGGTLSIGHHAIR